MCRALQEHGIEVVFVDDTRIGAALATLVASEQPLQREIGGSRRSFQVNPKSGSNRLPLLSIISGRHLRRVVGRALTDLYFDPPAA